MHIHKASLSRAVEHLQALQDALDRYEDEGKISTDMMNHLSSHMAMAADYLRQALDPTARQHKPEKTV